VPTPEFRREKAEIYVAPRRNTGAGGADNVKGDGLVTGRSVKRDDRRHECDAGRHATFLRHVT